MVRALSVSGSSGAPAAARGNAGPDRQGSAGAGGAETSGCAGTGGADTSGSAGTGGADTAGSAGADTFDSASTGDADTAGSAGTGGASTPDSAGADTPDSAGAGGADTPDSAGAGLAPIKPWVPPPRCRSGPGAAAASRAVPAVPEEGVYQDQPPGSRARALSHSRSSIGFPTAGAGGAASPSPPAGARPWAAPAAGGARPPPGPRQSAVERAGAAGWGCSWSRGWSRSRQIRASPPVSMKVEFAPINIPLKRRIQTVAVLQWIFSFLLLGQFCCGFFVILILGNFWFLAVLYLLWLYLDWETPCAGGRRSQWVRSWTVWKYFREYFPIHLIKTSDLNPNHNYLLGFHPHGVLVAGAFGNFCTGPSFKNLFPGLTPYLHIMPIWFGCPFFREYVMSAGMVSASKESVSYVLNNEGGGHASVIVIGGAEESLNAHPGSLTLNILKRKGFIKMALKHGAHLVPVFSFGENELFKQVANPKGSWLRNVQEKMQKIMGFALPLFHARGVFQYSFGLIPYRQPIHTVVGSPIPVKRNLNPTTEEIDDLHALYLQKLRQLFEEHKRNYGIPEHKTLIFE